jgi:hypothetical protein
MSHSCRLSSAQGVDHAAFHALPGPAWRRAHEQRRHCSLNGPPCLQSSLPTGRPQSLPTYWLSVCRELSKYERALSEDYYDDQQGDPKHLNHRVSW